MAGDGSDHDHGALMAAKKKPPMLTAAERKTLRSLLDKLDGVDTPRIETPRENTTGRKVRNANKRAFWIDGVNAHLRRKKANPAIIERTDEKVRKGEYKHVRTSDDVEIYEIAEWSPLRRKKVNVSEMSEKALEKAIVRAACKEDWRLYYDAASELAYRYKNSELPQATAQLQYQTQMRYIEHRIMRRGGPTPMRIQSELASIRKQRTGTRIYLPH